MTEQDTPQDEDLRMMREWRTNGLDGVFTVPASDDEKPVLVVRVTDEYFGAWLCAMRNTYLADPPHRSFASDLTKLLNYWNKELPSNTPDHLLSTYLERCLDAGHILIGRRDSWYGVGLAPGREPEVLVDAEIVDEP